MKILHTADWHLGKRLANQSRYDEQKAVLHEIATIANHEDVDLVLIAGDLFDTFTPTADVEDLLYATLKALTDGGRRPVVAIAGNHDNPDRIEAQDHFARECGIVFAGYPKTRVRQVELSCETQVIQSKPGFIELKLPRHSSPVRLLLTPYANEVRLLQAFLDPDQADQDLRQHLARHWQHLADDHMDEQGVNLLMAHLFVMKRHGEQPAEPDSERSIVQVGGASVIYSDLIPAQVQYAALGHLHRYQHIGGGPCPVVYSSSPLAYSFAEADQQKYVVLVSAEPGQPVTVEPVPLLAGRRLLRKTITGAEVSEGASWVREHNDHFTELTVQTDTHLSSEEHRQLSQSSTRFMGVRIEVRPTEANPAVDSALRIDLCQPVADLFTEYFKAQKKQEPNVRLLNLLREILAVEPEK